MTWPAIFETPADDQPPIRQRDADGHLRRLRITDGIYIQDHPALGEYQNYAPTYTNLTVGNGTVVARYARAVNMIHVWYELTFGSTTSITGSNPRFSLPVTASSSYTTPRTVLGTAYLLDTGTADAIGAVRLQSTTQVVVVPYTAGGTYVSQTNMSATVPWTWTTGDIISWYAAYEAA